MSLNYKSLLVVIPTRNRAELAINAVNSVLSQEHCELELIVSDNSTDATEVSRLSSYCQQSDDKRLRYIRPPKPLPMTEHWNWAMEQSLQISESNHITYLTDRLLFARNRLQNLQRILTKHPDKIVSYTFDSIEDSEFPISLSQISYTGKLFEIQSASILKIYAEMERIQALPKMLNSVASRELMTKIFEKYGNYFFSVSPDYNLAFRSLDLEESILYYDRPLLISYGNNRSNGWNVLQGNFNQDALDFINNLSSTEICFESPVKAIWVLPNAIIHEYCYAKPSAVSDRFPEINQNKYLVSLVENVAAYKNERMREEMLEKLHTALGSGLAKYRAQAAIERKYKGLKIRLHNLANASTPYLLKHNFENVEDAIDYATDSPRKPVSDFKLIEDRTGAKPSKQGPVKVLKDFYKLADLSEPSAVADGFRYRKKPPFATANGSDLSNPFATANGSDPLTVLMFKKIYSTKVNVIANFVGSVWIAVLSIVFVPIYLHYIGVESYGLIGVFSSLQALIILLDFGLSPTLNRELARLSALDDRTQEMHDIQRTLEIPNWIFAGFIGLFLTALAPLIARFWVQPKDLSVETITQAFIILGVNIAIQFSVNFYVGGLMGLQKQLLLSLINIFCGTLRSVGAFVVLAYISPTIQGFLLWQGFVIILQVGLMALTLKNSLPDAPRRGRFQKDLFSKVWRFAAGMTGITISALVLTQTDKIILSRMLNLETFGYYILALTISGLITGIVVSSINHAVYPRFSRLVSVGDEVGLREFYHHGCQIVSVFLFPPAIILVLFSYDILLIWIGKEEIAVNTYLLLSLITIGHGLNSLVYLPHSAQLAHGWTTLSFYENIVAIVVLIPFVIFGVYHYGAVGGAVVWVIVNIFLVLVPIQIMHRRILKGEKLRWYLEDLGLPFIIALLVAGGGKILLGSNRSKSETIVGLLIISAATLLLTALSTKATRYYLKDFRNRLYRFYENE